MDSERERQDRQEGLLFLMCIMDGYSFRNTMAIIKNETDNATMILSPTEIEISLINTSKCGVHRIKLNGSEFSDYYYNIRDEKDEIIQSYPIAFNTNEMLSTTKGIGRKDGIRIYWMEGENRISVQPVKNAAKNSGQAGALFVSIVQMEHKRYEIGQYCQDPNVKVTAKEFADICSQANGLKCSCVELSCRRNSVVIRPVRPNQKIAGIHRFDSHNRMGLISAAKANESEPGATGGSPDEIALIKIPILMAKSLSKIHNLSANGTQLRFYFSKGDPIKIESPIGNYGSYTICIR